MLELAQDTVQDIDTDYITVAERLSSQGEALRNMAFQSEQQSRVLHILANLIERYLGPEDQEVTLQVLQNALRPR